MAKTSKQLKWCKECGKDKYIEVKLHAASGDRVVFCVAGHALGKIVTAKTMVSKQRSRKEIIHERQTKIFMEQMKGKI